MTKTLPRKQTKEWSFQRTDECSGELTYRCLCFHVESDNTEFSDSELELLKEMVDTLNFYFDDPAK